MSCGIYRIMNKINGKSYIGASENIERRFNEHKFQKKEPMYPIIKKYGKSNFTYEILEECPVKEFYDKERYYIKIHDTKVPNGYNKSDGGATPHNSTGYYHVRKVSNSVLRQGFQWVYGYDDESGKAHLIVDVDLNCLKRKVTDKGLKWKIIDEEKAAISREQNSVWDIKNIRNNNSGLYRVTKQKENNYLRGYVWKYTYTDSNNNMRYIYNQDLRELKNQVINKGLPWVIIDKSKADISFKENLKDIHNIPDKSNKTGYYGVYKSHARKRNIGYYFIYDVVVNKKRNVIQSINIQKLEQKVKSKGLPWKIVDVNKANFTLQQNLKDLQDVKNSNKKK